MWRLQIAQKRLQARSRDHWKCQCCWQQPARTPIVWRRFRGRLEWKFWDWNSTNKQKQVLKLNQEIIQSEQDNFIRNIDNQLLQQETEVVILRQAIETDEKMVKLQQDITETASSQLEEGTISASDYLTELNNLTQSKLQLASDQIKLAKAIVTQTTLSGNTP